jgi:hypothetical protein
MVRRSAETEGQVWFAVGVLAALVAWLVLATLLAQASIGWLNLALLLFGCLLGGAIAGRSLRLGKRGVVGFGVAFVVALPILILRLIGIQGMGGKESNAILVVDLGGTGLVAFALMATAGLWIAGVGGRQVLRAVAGFACAGFVGGLLLAACIAASPAGNHVTNQILLVIGLLAFLVLPAALGGSILARHLTSDERARRTERQET